MEVLPDVRSEAGSVTADVFADRAQDAVHRLLSMRVREGERMRSLSLQFEEMARHESEACVGAAECRLEVEREMAAAAARIEEIGRALSRHDLAIRDILARSAPGDSEVAAEYERAKVRAAEAADRLQRSSRAVVGGSGRGPGKASLAQRQLEAWARRAERRRESLARAAADSDGDLGRAYEAAETAKAAAVLGDGCAKAYADGKFEREVDILSAA